MNLFLWFAGGFAFCCLLIAFAIVWCSLIVGADSDSVAGFFPSVSDRTASGVPSPPRSPIRRGSMKDGHVNGKRAGAPARSQRHGPSARPVDPGLPARPLGPGRELLDDGNERFAWDWRAREAELRGDA